MSESDHEELADRYEQEASELERRNRDLAEDVKGAGEDWKRKRADDNVPGAQPTQPGEEAESDQEPRSDEEREGDPDEGSSEDDSA